MSFNVFKNLSKSSGGGFRNPPEGWNIFEITKVDNKPTFFKTAFYLRTANGETAINTFNYGKNGKVNEKVVGAMSYFIHCAMNNFDIEEIEDEQELVGKFIKSKVEHNIVDSTKDEGETITFVNFVETKALTDEEYNNAILQFGIEKDIELDELPFDLSVTEPKQETTNSSFNIDDLL